MEDSENLFINIRIGLNCKVNSVISYCKNALNNKKCKGLNINGVGGSIGKLIEIVESLKIIISGLYQVNRLTSVAYLPVGNNNGEKTLYPKMEVKLSLEKPTVIQKDFKANCLKKKEKNYWMFF